MYVVPAITHGDLNTRCLQDRLIQGPGWSHTGAKFLVEGNNVPGACHHQIHLDLPPTCFLKELLVCCCHGDHVGPKSVGSGSWTRDPLGASLALTG